MRHTIEFQSKNSGGHILKQGGKYKRKRIYCTIQNNFIDQNYTRFHQRRLTLISVQLLLLRIKKAEQKVGMAQIKINRLLLSFSPSYVIHNRIAE